MGTPNKQEEEKEKVLFYKKLILEVIEKQYYSEIMEDDIKSKEVKIDGKVHYIHSNWGKFDEIMESLKKKIEVLPYVDDGAYKVIVEEILVDIGRLLYKFEYKDRI